MYTKQQINSYSSLELVKEIAFRMRDPLWIKDQVMHPNNQNPYPIYNIPYWHDLSVASGYPGVLPIFAELDCLFPSEGWDSHAHQYILKIKESIELQGVKGLSIFGGVSGICFYIQLASKGEARYKKIITALNRYLSEKIEEVYLIPLKKNISLKKPSPMELYDLMQGVVGVGLHVLNHLHEPTFSYLASEILQVLISLTYPLELEGKEVPGWYTPPQFFYLEEEKQRDAKGNFNLGLSHGISGILGFLSIALLRGVVINGQIQAIQHISNWIKKKRRQSDGSLFWESSIKFEEEINELTPSPKHVKDAWCYGTPGVGRSLYLAGKALKDEELIQYSLDSYCSIFTRKQEEWNLPGPTFCHGISGLLMTTHLMARDSQSLILKENVNRLENILLGFYHVDNPFGFKDAHPSSKGGYIGINQAGILEGASGILLTLLSLHSKSFSWHLPFLIDS